MHGIELCHSWRQRNSDVGVVGSEEQYRLNVHLKTAVIIVNRKEGDSENFMYAKRQRHSAREKERERVVRTE